MRPQRYLGAGSRELKKGRRQPPGRTESTANKKAPTLTSGAFSYGVPGSDLLSHTNAYYHRRDFVSRPCSGWEGVGPKRYDRQA
jgi:hypothetical protein